MYNLKRDLVSKINNYFMKYNVSQDVAHSRYGLRAAQYVAIKSESPSSLREVDLVSWWGGMEDE
jgi:hypothetical protein